MTIAIEASGTYTAATAASVELPLPANAAGELLLAFGMCGFNSNTDGATLDIDEAGYGNKVSSNNTADSDSTAIVESKVSEGDETASLTLKITGTDVPPMKGQVFAVSGVHADVWDATPVVGTGASNTTTYATPAITTTTANAVVISVAHKDGGGIGPFTEPSGYTSLIDPDSQSGNGRLMAAYKVIASPGVETPGTWGGGVSTSDWGGFTIALKAGSPLAIKILAHPSAASATTIEGAVYADPTSEPIHGPEIGQFTGQTFEATTEGSGDDERAVLLVPVADFGGGSLALDDTVVATARNGTYTTGYVAGVVIEV